MNEQKSLIYQLAEAYERHRIERRTIAPEQNVQSQQPGRCHRFETHRRAGERGAVQRGTGQPDLRRHPDEHLERRSLPGDHGKWGDACPARVDPLCAHRRDGAHRAEWGDWDGAGCERGSYRR